MAGEPKTAGVTASPAASPAPAPSEPESRMESLRKWADVLAKLAGAVAIAGVTWFVAGLESTMSSIDLLAKREEAETRLRASMFTALVDPVLGPRSEGEAPDANRQRLLAELLTLNFHDHIEFKPLLIHVDTLVANDADTSDPDRSRESLRSVARRVIDRQVNALSAAANSMNLQAKVKSITALSKR